jgi:hypothetical protein
MGLIENAFNYNVHGRTGFELLAAIVDRADCYTFTYNKLEDAVTFMDRLAAHDGPKMPGGCQHA